MELWGSGERGGGKMGGWGGVLLCEAWLWVFAVCAFSHTAARSSISGIRFFSLFHSPEGAI